LVGAGVVFLGVLPYMIVVAGPQVDRLLGLNRVSTGPVFFVIAAILFIPGAAFGFSAVFLQLGRGEGTPLPVIPTRRLLTTGPYRYCRNPMTLGTLLMYLGLGVAAATLSGTALVLILGTVLLVYLKRVEEGELAERFGADYVAYRRDVPFILPRIPRV
jgi:protein-S-isoprenylcysteine O-methyltransferase Ste14